MNYEQLGVFYLGREVDASTGARAAHPFLYRSKDLLTHGICVGMTGSGKTGLCIDVLEEAAIDGIPAIVIDPKGDMTNLLLSFPGLSGADLAPWVNPDEAQQQGMSVGEFAERQAKIWNDGLAQWGQSRERIAMMRQNCDFRLYTPGDEGGRPISILEQFSYPGDAVAADSRALAELAGGMASALLGLLGLNADPVQSREYILLTNILLAVWLQRQSVDLPALVSLIQQPPFNVIGALQLETYYPASERFNLAMRCNSLLASPSFSAWLSGEPLSIDNLLYDSKGRPRISILTISHLNDNERMFFVTLLLNRVVSWMRRQSASSSLRALLYMDEIFGYFPPVANPPSKEPLLTLLKQARAYGLGVMLTTQNPVDLDYKGLSNIGTWFIGRLQTERDRQRLLDGLQEVADSSGTVLERSGIDRLLAGLEKRVFLMNNVHAGQALLFETRWCLSYLRGPLNRPEVQRLIAESTPEAAAFPGAPGVAAAAGATVAAPFVPQGFGAAAGQYAQPFSEPSTTPVAPPVAAVTPQLTGVPRVASGISQVWSLSPESQAAYRPWILATVKVWFEDKTKAVSAEKERTVRVPLSAGPVAVDWDMMVDEERDLNSFSAQPPITGTYTDFPEGISARTNFTAWQRALVDYFYRNERITVYACKPLKMYGDHGEDERAFRLRVEQRARELRDAEIDKLTAKYERTLAGLEEQIRKAEQAVRREKEQASAAKADTAISLGSAALSLFLGRGRSRLSTLGRATTTARSASRSARQSKDVARYAEDVDAKQERYEKVAAELDAKIEEITARYEELMDSITESEVAPLKKDITVPVFALLWQAD